jgi:hypothetical protein
MFLLICLSAVMAVSACAAPPDGGGTTTPGTLVPAVAAPDTAEPCAYVEATQDLPDISAEVDAAMKALQSGASGRAVAYGETCVTNGGTASFGAMETDFYVTLSVQNLTDDDELGNRIADVMTALESFKPGVVPGPEPGFAEITFQAGADQKVLHVPIRAYEQLPPGLSGAEIIQTLFPNQ